MRLRFRRSHIYLLFLLIVFAVGWLVLIRLDTKFGRSYAEDFTRVRVKSGKWLNKLATPSSLVNSRAYRGKDFSSDLTYQSISCLINNEHSIGCLKSKDSTVWVPFNFVKRYFDIDGHLVKTLDGREYLNWEHSYSKIYRPKQPYNFKGPFLWFENYNVEVRDRVKCISGSKSVPISTQWEPKGHFYPIQIAQFGLSHFSKDLAQGPPRVVVIEDGSFLQEYWSVDKNSPGNHVNSRVQSIPEKTDEENAQTNLVLSISGEKVSFKFKRKKLSNDLILSMRLKPSPNFGFTLFLISDLGKEYSVDYAAVDGDFIDDKNSYGLGATFGQWLNITRDVGVDLQKAYSVSGRKLPVKTRNLRLSRITFRGEALIDDVLQSSNAHEWNFFSAVRWMVDNQDRKGGWPIQAVRRLCSGALVLNSGWYSAMAQGGGISLLTRAYHITKNETYLKAAIRALALFDMNSTVGGIKTYFLDDYVW